MSLPHTHIVVTSANARYFPHARMLLQSVLETSGGLVDTCLLFDLGLMPEQRAELAAMPRVQVLDYPKSLADIYPDYLAPGHFAWKTYAIKEAGRLGRHVLYLDSGIVVLHSLRPILEWLRRDGIFLVQDSHTNAEYTHERCFEIMHATAAERTAHQISAGIIGYTVGGPFQGFVDEAFEFSKIRACITGDPAHHRHDQSIYSILACRYPVPHFCPFGPLCDDGGIKHPGQVLYIHRGQYLAYPALRERLRALPAGTRVALYGAGQHTRRMLLTLRSSIEPHGQLVGILDDNPGERAHLEGFPIVATRQWATLSPAVVIVSSDMYEVPMYERVRAVLPDAVQVWKIYNGEFRGSAFAASIRTA